MPREENLIDDVTAANAQPVPRKAGKRDRCFSTLMDLLSMTSSNCFLHVLLQRLQVLLGYLAFEIEEQAQMDGVEAVVPH